MSLNFYELANSRPVAKSVNSASVTVKFIAMYSADEVAVTDGLLLVSPPLFDGLKRQSVKCDPIGSGIWMCDVEYAFNSSTQTDSPDPPDTPSDITPLGPETSFDFTAGQSHITQSLLTRYTRGKGDAAAGPAFGSAPVYKQAIGVTRDRVEGCDIYSPKFEFSVTVQVAPVTLPMLRTWRSLVARTNNAPWRGFDNGEVLYLGGSGQCKPGNVWSVTHKFAAGENLYLGDPRLVISPQIVLPGKPAWDYVWCTYSDEKDAAVDRLVQVPQAAYVEKVYHNGDFELLGIGS